MASASAGAIGASCSGWPSNPHRLGRPVESVPEEIFGPFRPIFAMDQPASSAYTRETLGWQPTHPGLFEDLENLQP